ncbi:hypothetical protein ACSMFT_23230 [Ectopseudomonas oleovorans]|uniref:hypothetical protein n=1 Tax=Ectopseudomonas oleovorans TaxID=301 RepID=UPI003F1BC923
MPAQAATLADVKRLATNSYPHLQIADDLLADLVKSVKGCLRRAAVNLYRVSSECTAKGLREVDLATWTAGWFTGEPPRRGAK